MKKTVLASALVIGLLSTAAFAFNQNCPNFGQRGMQGNMPGSQQGMMMNQKGNCNMQGKGMYGMKGQRGGMMPMLANLDLTQEQQYKLSILRDEMKLEMKKSMGMNQRPDFSKFITTDGFDKEAFTKSMDERHEKMIALRAAHMKKVFAVLTPEQIAKLKTL